MIMNPEVLNLIKNITKGKKVLRVEVHSSDDNKEN